MSWDTHGISDRPSGWLMYACLLEDGSRSVLLLRQEQNTSCSIIHTRLTAINEINGFASAVRDGDVRDSGIRGLASVYSIGTQSRHDAVDLCFVWTFGRSYTSSRLFSDSCSTCVMTTQRLEVSQSMSQQFGLPLVSRDSMVEVLSLMEWRNIDWDVTTCFRLFRDVLARRYIT
jgi:hypothetical protein